MKVLGIESSCDETGVAIYDDEKGLLCNQLYSQIKLHAEYGGVVPELASRDHIRMAIKLVKAALDEAKCTKDDIDAVAYTAGPGLIGALMVGATVARTLAYAWNKPAVPVNHMEGHFGILILPLPQTAGLKFYRSLFEMLGFGLRDIDLIKTFPDARVGFSINTLDETFKDDMDKAVSYVQDLLKTL